MGDIMVTYIIIETEHGFGFELVRDGAVFQRQLEGSNSETWTEQEAKDAAQLCVDYWSNVLLTEEQ